MSTSHPTPGSASSHTASSKGPRTSGKAASRTASVEGSSQAVPDKDRVFIFDTTLRDGEQCPGATMTFEDKLEVASLLDEMGVDIIEAGFPIASDGDFEAVSEISRRTSKAIVAGLARAVSADIARAGAAVRQARKPRIHTFVSTSPIHLAHQMRKSEEEVLAIIAATVTQARGLVEDVEWSAMDATRTPIDYLCRCVEAAIRAGATTINLPDTVGYATPQEYGRMFRTVRERVPDSDKAIFSVHCHNDLGLAVANTIAGIEGGARQVECTINGIGERAGNAALEEIVMAIRTRADALPYATGIETQMLTRASRLVSAVTSFPVQYNKAIVGRNAFAHESGIHQDGILKNAQTYEIMTPESVGVAKTALVMGKHSGRHAFREKLKELGYQLGDNALEDAFRRFKDLADRKKHVYDEDIEALVDNEIVAAHDRIKLVALTVIAGTMGPQSATLTLDIDGTHVTRQSTGNGPVDATFNAIHALVPHTASLDLYQVHAVTEGTDAQAEVSVRLTEDGKTVTGRGADPDTLVASARAYLGALNKLMVKRLKAGKPEQLSVG
ncbi:MAG: 2-isopropylmalate synthase [Methylobacteriaceae bacterium]|nr:2-isopropylmalate synthase [Methylobacteriaceae bacterium]MBV9637559.1 2-isopropylmalate synthase [Methylobacteriaceae bacterium]